MSSESVVRQINNINRKHAIDSRGDRAAADAPAVKNNDRPYKSRIAVAGARDRRRSRNRRRSVTARRKKWLSPVAMITAAAVLIAALGGGIGYALWFNSFTDIKLSEHAEVTLSGFDHYGQATLQVTADSEYQNFWDTVSASLDRTDGLSNGDEITVTYSYDADTAHKDKLRVDDTEAHITVEGLPDAVVIDHDSLFESLKVTFEGMSPCITVSLENTSDDPFLSCVSYTAVGSRTKFASGETVEILAEIDEEKTSELQGYVTDLTEDDYTESVTVPEGLGYLTDASQITADDLAELEQAGYDLISKADAKEYGLRIFQQEAHLKPLFVGNTTTFKWSSPYVISAYFHNVTEAGREIPESHANDVQIVYGVTLSQDDGQSVEAEMVIQFANLYEKEDGTNDLSLDSGKIVSASYRNSNIKKLVSGDSDGMYDTTKLTE